MEVGLNKKWALNRLWFTDINGLVVFSRNDLVPHNLPYAHDHEQLNFIDASTMVKAEVLIGAIVAAGVFTKEVIELMFSINERPLIFALSNPTSKWECTAEEAYKRSNGSAILQAVVLLTSFN